MLSVATAAIAATGTGTEGSSAATFTICAATSGFACSGCCSVTDTLTTYTIDWGDGTPGNPDITTGTFPAGSTTSSATVSHVYANASSGAGYAVVFTANSLAGNKAGTTTARVNDAALSSPQGIDQSGVIVGQPISGTLATFTDANSSASTSNFTATIDWGVTDSSGNEVITTGTLIQTGSGQFAVQGGNTYNVPGIFHATVNVTDDGGSTTQMTLTASVDYNITLDTSLFATTGMTSYVPVTLTTYDGSVANVNETLTLVDNSYDPTILTPDVSVAITGGRGLLGVTGVSEGTSPLLLVTPNGATSKPASQPVKNATIEFADDRTGAGITSLKVAIGSHRMFRVTIKDARGNVQPVNPDETDDGSGKERDVLVQNAGGQGHNYSVWMASGKQLGNQTDTFKKFGATGNLAVTVEKPTITWAGGNTLNVANGAQGQTVTFTATTSDGAPAAGIVFSTPSSSDSNSVATHGLQRTQTSDDQGQNMFTIDALNGGNATISLTIPGDAGQPALFTTDADSSLKVTVN